MIFLGIDPGLDGALAILWSPHPSHIDVYDTPTVTVQASKGTKREYNEAQMRSYLAPFAGEQAVVFIEKVHSMPGQGVRSMFSMGYGVGLWEGLLAGLGIPYERVAPQRWQKLMLADEGKGKDAARLQAQRIFPQYAQLFARKKDHGRADAALMAEFGRRTRG